MQTALELDKKQPEQRKPIMRDVVRIVAIVFAVVMAVSGALVSAAGIFTAIIDPGECTFGFLGGLCVWVLGTVTTTWLAIRAVRGWSARRSGMCNSGGFPVLPRSPNDRRPS